LLCCWHPGGVDACPPVGSLLGACRRTPPPSADSHERGGGACADTVSGYKSSTRHRLAGGGAASGKTQRFYEHHHPWSGCCLWEGCVTAFVFEFSSLTCPPILTTHTLLWNEHMRPRIARHRHQLYLRISLCRDSALISVGRCSGGLLRDVHTAPCASPLSTGYMRVRCSEMMFQSALASVRIASERGVDTGTDTHTNHMCTHATAPSNRRKREEGP